MSSPQADSGDEDPTRHLIGLGVEHGTHRGILLDLAQVLQGRVIIAGNSGCGKSWTLRRILEQAYGKVQQVILDPEGEFANLGEDLGHQVAESRKLALDAHKLVAKRVVEHRLDLVLELSRMDRADMLAKAAAFLAALMEAAEEHRHPILLVCDEAHLIAPGAGATGHAAEAQRLATSALVDIASRGRKYGLALVTATTRLTKIATSISAESNSAIIGRTTLDNDLSRAANVIGWSLDKTSMLRDSKPGDFVGVGTAFGGMPRVFRVGPVRTRHGGHSPDLDAPPRRDRNEASALLGLSELPEEVDREASPVDSASRMRGVNGGSHVLFGFLADPRATFATKIMAALAAVSPNAAELRNIAEHLAVDVSKAEDAIAMLERLGAVEVRRPRGMLLVRPSAAVRQLLWSPQITSLREPEAGIV